MSTITEKLDKLNNIKQDIKSVLIEKGKEPTDNFETYSGIISELNTSDYEVVEDSLTLSETTSAFVIPEKNTLYRTVTYTRTSFNLNTWAPLCLPFDVDAEQLQRIFGGNYVLWELINMQFDDVNKKLYINYMTTDTVIAGHIYIIKPTNYGTPIDVPDKYIESITSPIVFNNVIIKNDVSVKQHKYSNIELVPGLQITHKPIASFNVLPIYIDDFYYNNSGQLLHRTGSQAKIQAYRAFFVYEHTGFDFTNFESVSNVLNH